MLQKVYKESGKEAEACARTSALRLRLVLGLLYALFLRYGEGLKSKYSYWGIQLAIDLQKWTYRQKLSISYRRYIDTANNSEYIDIISIWLSNQKYIGPLAESQWWPNTNAHIGQCLYLRHRGHSYQLVSQAYINFSSTRRCFIVRMLFDTL